MRSASSRVRILLAAAALVLTLFPIGPATAATTRYVDRGNPSCNNSGPGTSAIPYCTIQRAANVVVAGDTVIVRSGTYPETVEIEESGTPSAPITFETAPGANVIVNGGSHGFEFPEVDWIVLRGFTVRDTTDHAIYLSGSTNLRIEGNDVSGAGAPIDGDEANGIYVSDTVDTVISGNAVHHNTDSGIYLKGDTTRVQVLGNEVFANAAVFERVSPGIDVRASGNTVIGNKTYNNEDTGIQIYPGGNNTLVANNLSYDNGDHGIDVLEATGQRIIGNTVLGSSTAGINVEGGSTGTTIANNIAMNNAVSSPRTVGNIRVDDGSVPGTTTNYNLVFQSTSAPLYSWNETVYNSLSALRAATGQETNGIQANPLFRDAGADDYHLTAASPAVDSANSGVGGQQASDLDGTPRHDYPAVANTGAGPRSFDDRGAFEFRPSGAPVTANDNASTSEDTAVSIDVLANDVDPEGDPLSLSIASQPSHGNASVNTSNTITYTPATNYFGNDSFSYTATDASGGSGTATVQITVSPANDNPLALNDIGTTVTNQAININVLANDTDVDGDALSVSGVTNPAHGSTSINPSGTVRYQPAAGYEGGDSFNYTVSDGNGGSATGRVDITVEDGGSVPIATDDQATTDEDQTVRIDVLDNDSDPGGGALSIDGVTQPAHGSVTVTASDEIDYVPAANYHGGDSFTYVVTNPGGASASAQVSVTVNARNDDPTAGADSASTPAGTAVSIAVLANDGDVDGDGLTLTGVSNPAHGSTAIAGGNIVYTPNSGYVGPDSFEYEISDGAGGTASAQVSITVTAAQELVGNPGFESSTAGWAGSPGGITVTRVAGGHSGGWAGRVNNGNGGNAANCTLNDSPNWVAQSQAGTYSVSLWVRAGSPGATFKLRIREYAGSSSVGSQTVTSTLTTNWQRVNLNYTVDSPGSTLDFSAYSMQAPPGTCFFADDVSITRS
jgi:parallel beta-helix repeat protein